MSWSLKIQNDNRLAALVLRAINHKLRREIINLIQENGAMTVTDIYVRLRLEQSVVSQHLAILRRSGIVNTDRMGKYVYYSVDEERLKFILETASNLSKCHSFYKESISI